MKILHHMKKEDSGLSRSTLELVNAEEKLGHQVQIRQPKDNMPIYGHMDGRPDIHCIHSQIHPSHYHDGIPKIMWMHGEPLGSVGNGISMKAICDLAPVCDAFICMRHEELPVWSAIKRTHLVPKGIDLDIFTPLSGVTEKLSGEPAVLYYENWRGQRNPLYPCVAMARVHQELPDARLHLFNCRDKRMLEAFKALNKQCKWWPFLRTMEGPQEDANLLLNRVDIVVSGLYPLYARGIEAFGAGKAFIGPGYHEHAYPWTCELDVESMADAIMACWKDYSSVDYRKWAEDHHDVMETAKQAVKVYERYAV